MQIFQFIYIYICVSISMAVLSCFAERAINFETDASRFWKNITVSNSGNGDFKTIQEAIDKGVPINNNKWIHIYVTAGIYWGNVSIPQNKPYIVLEGERMGSTWVDYNTSVNFWNSTLNVEADNFIAKSLTFKNTYNLNSMKPAVAAVINGDKNSFYNCGFMSVQDTLFDAAGRHFFHGCYIEGLVDFIMGNGQSIYQDCKIKVTGSGYIAAQNRERADQPTGFVFKFCNVVGTGKVYLGRAYGPYSRVLFYKTNLSSIVAPEGWDAWTFKGKEDKFTFAEENCYGPGSDTSKRVRWEKKLSPAEKEWLTGPKFIDSDGWIRQQPLKMMA